MGKEKIKMLIVAIITLLCTPWALFQDDFIMVVLCLIGAVFAFYAAFQLKNKDIVANL